MHGGLHSFLQLHVTKCLRDFEIVGLISQGLPVVIVFVHPQSDGPGSVGQLLKVWPDTWLAW